MMHFKNKKTVKLLLFFVALAIGVGSIIYTRLLVNTLKEEERKKVELWAQATAELSSDQTSSLDLVFDVIRNNTTVPVILTDKDYRILSSRNIFSENAKEDTLVLKNILIEMRQSNDSIIVALGGANYQLLFYKESNVITKLSLFTTIQLLVMIVFITISYLAFNNSRRIEQNKVWVGLSKETAHQLGTPTSSLLGWVGLLKLKEVEPDIVLEIEKDVNHLQRVVDRFSKIGAEPELKEADIIQVIADTIDYLKIRTSSQVEFKLVNDVSKALLATFNKTLIEWVLENICKNGIDAIQGKGVLKIIVSQDEKYTHIDITDTGKGIQKKLHKAIFSPGYTTKKRGWGLGLSLAKRIIEIYHKGKLYVKESESGKGTTFRISLINKY